MDATPDLQLPLSSLRLLVPPVRLMSACMWQVAQQCNVNHYGKLAEFITLVTEMVPEILSPKQRTPLILGLRARLTLDLLKDLDPFDPQVIQNHLNSVHLWTKNSMYEQGQEENVAMSHFVKLVRSLLSHSSDREQFFKEVFPVQYGASFDKALQSLVWEFFSKLEEFLPVPSFSQVASSLSHSLHDLDQCGQFISDPVDLRRLLQHHQHQQKLNKSQLSHNCDAILSTLESKQTSEVCKDEQHKEEEGTGTSVKCETNLVEEDFLGEKTKTECMDAVVVGTDCVQNQQDIPPMNCSSFPEVSEETAGCAVFQEPGCSESSVTGLKKPQDLSRGEEALEENGKRYCTNRTKEHTCLDCGKTFKFLYLLKGHRAVHSLLRPFQCSQCDKMFKTEKSMKLHRKVHSVQKHLQCEQCEKRFKSQNGLKLHLQLHKGSGEIHKKYTCLQCGKTFGYLSNFRRHSNVHSGAQPFHCSLCDKRFKTKESLNIHLRRHTGERPFACSYCSRRFLSSQVLKSHLRTHTGERPFACTLCNRRFIQSHLLTVHLRRHKKEKPYLCSACGMSFYCSGSLLVHSRTHTGERPHHCNYCGKDYITSTRLAIHLRYHTGERPYSCSQCDKSFHTTSTLNKHMRTHTGEKPFQCLKCHKTFSQRANMKVHLKSHDT